MQTCSKDCEERSPAIGLCYELVVGRGRKAMRVKRLTEAEGMRGQRRSSVGLFTLFDRALVPRETLRRENCESLPHAVAKGVEKVVSNAFSQPYNCQARRRRWAQLSTKLDWTAARRTHSQGKRDAASGGAGSAFHQNYSMLRGRNATGI